MSLALGDKVTLVTGVGNGIASAALYLASDASRWVTGTELTVDGGFKIRSR